jgi:hypothetical protein
MAVQRGSSGYQVLIPNATDSQGEPMAVPVELTVHRLRSFLTMLGVVTCVEPVETSASLR